MVAPCPATLGAPRPRTLRLRALLLTTAITLALAMPLAQAQEKLPDIGSSAGELLTPARQAEPWVPGLAPTATSRGSRTRSS
ncbi:hypothetical protein G6F35_017672 [Rhizopus arrhizus]|nr:hypothetical protein G6F35_017672 [Rhizopus arrhizus]